jgi:tetratricopeptide (TPR) repeat protein
MVKRKNALTANYDISKYSYIILAIITFAVFANSLANEFVFDDESVILSDPTITQLSNIPKFFSGQLGFHKVIGAYYRPVISSSYAIDYAIWQYNPFGFHLTNILIHIINVLLLFKLLSLMFKNYSSPYKNYIILISVLIFAVHPVHTEVVAWVSGRTDGLACTFFFASFIFYLIYAENPVFKNILLTLTLYLFALFAKEMAITLPAVILLYELIVNKLKIKEFIKSRYLIFIFYILVSLFYLLLRYLALKDEIPRETYFYFYQKDSITAFLTMLQTLPIYFRLSIAPYGLLYHYSGYLPDISSITEPRALYAVFFIIIMISAAIFFIRKSPYISFSIIIFFVTLLPVMNIVPSMNFMAERFLYIPSFFLSIIVAAVLFKYFNDKSYNYVMGISAAVLIIFIYMTYNRNAEWKTNNSLFLSAEGRPGTVTYVNIGNIYANKGDFDIAEVYYRKAIDLRKESLVAYNNIGKIFMVRENFDSAYYYINKAYLLDTLSPEPMFTFAQMYQRKGDIHEAIKWLEKVSSFAPNYYNAAQLLEEFKQIASDSLKQNIQIPKMPPVLIDEKLEKIRALEESTYKNYRAKNYEQAINELKQLIELVPEKSAGYYNNIGMCYLDQGNFNEAIKFFEIAVSKDPKFSSAYNNIGNAYEKMNDIEKAKFYYNKALEIDPNNALAKQNLQNLNK